MKKLLLTNDILSPNPHLKSQKPSLHCQAHYANTRSGLIG
jgi:hypothetical protein